MDSLVQQARGALLDQRTLQPRFREAQLDVLFRVLQENGQNLIDQLSTEASGIRPRLEAELAYALTTINDLSNGLPSPKVWWEGQTKLPMAATEKHLPAGVVVIEANTHHPVLSIVIPLACSISSGNAAIVTNIGQAGQISLTNQLKRALDQDVYHFTTSERDESVPVDAQISFASSSGKRKTSSSIIGRVGYRPAIGPVPIIIDQSCLDGKPLPHPLDNPNYPIPKTLRKAVDDLKAVLEHEGEARKNASWRSSASPSYILVHENILPLFQRAIETSGVSSLAQFEFQSIANAQAILEALPSPTALQYIPIFTCTSLDRAIDFVNNEAPKPTVSFIFASPSFSAYAANQLEGDDVVIGGIPESIIVQGPYHRLNEMQFYKTKSISLASVISKQTTKARWTEIASKAIKRKSDKRIDFFFSGILLSFGLTASTLLGLSGYGAYKGIVLAWRYYQRVKMA